MLRYKGRVRGTWGIAASAVLLSGLAGCGDGGADRGEVAAAEVAREAEVVLEATDLIPVERGRIRTAVSLTGSLDPYQVVEVRAQVPGTVADLRVDRGEAVSRGAVMAVLEAQGIRGQAAGARAGVAAAEASLALAKQRLESARLLHQEGALSQIDLRSAETAYEAAEAQLAAAKAQAAGAIEAARRATVTAPIAGEVSKRLVSMGEAVNPGQPLFTVVDTEYLELAGQVPVNEAARVHVGQPVEFSLAAYPGRVFEGRVARVEPTADPSTRQVGVYVRLPNREHRLLGGLFATGRILVQEQEDSVVLPVGAVRRDGGESFVWVVENGTAVRRPVTLGARDEGRGLVAVVKGVELGEQVIVAPGALEDGARVRVRGAAAEG